MGGNALLGAGQRPELGGYGRGLLGVHRAEGFLRLVQERPGVGGAVGGPAGSLWGRPRFRLHCTGASGPVGPVRWGMG